MKVFTFFYNRYETATTSKALYENGINHNILIHKEQDYELFKKGNTLFGNPIITNSPKGLAYQRNFALDMMDMGEWSIFMCDDFKKIYSYPKENILNNELTLDITFQNQHKFHLNKQNPISLKEMFEFFPKLIELAELNKIFLIGFGLHDNPLNLKKKFGHRGLADGRFWLVKKSNYKFDLNAQLIDDVAWTCENLIRHNNVLILNWTVPFFSRYTSGGFGSTSERKELRKKECNYLCNKFNPLIKMAHKPNWEYGTHIRIYGTDNNIKQARKKIFK
jgi:hypothetical protein